MRLEEFKAITKEQLTDAWGDKNFSPALLNKLWLIVRDISAGDLSYALENVNLQAHKAPSIAQIRTACHGAILRAKSDLKQSRLKQLAPCTLCDGSGWVEAYREAKPFETFAFICSCEAAKVLGIVPGRGGVPWSQASADETLKVRRFTDRAEKAYRDEGEAWLTKMGLVSYRDQQVAKERTKSLGENQDASLDDKKAVPIADDRGAGIPACREAQNGDLPPSPGDSDFRGF